MLKQRSSWRSILVHGAILSALVLIVWVPYSNSLTGELVYDNTALLRYDERLVNPSEALPPLGAIWSSQYWHSQSAFFFRHYRPLTTLSLAANYWPAAYSTLDESSRHAWRAAAAEGGLSNLPSLPRLTADEWKTAVQGFHLVNWICHLLNVALVYALCIALLRRSEVLGSNMQSSASDSVNSSFLHILAAFLAAAIFAVHPAFTESVSNIIGRADMQATGLTMVAFLLHLRSRDRVGTARMVWSVAAAVAYLAAMLSKEHAVSLLAIVMLYDVLQAGFTLAPVTWSGRTLRTLLPSWFTLGAAAACFFLVRWLVLRNVDPSYVDALNNPHVELPWLVSKLTAVKVLLLQFSLLLWPVKLSADYSFDAISAVQLRDLASPAGLLAALVVLLSTGLLLRSLSRGGSSRLLLFLLAAPLLLLLPTSNLLLTIGTIMAERFLYAPGVFICIALSVAALRVAAALVQSGVGGNRVDGRGFARSAIPALLLPVTSAALLLGSITWLAWWPNLPEWLHPELPAMLESARGPLAFLLERAWIIPVAVGSLLAAAVLGVRFTLAGRRVVASRSPIPPLGLRVLAPLLCVVAVTAAAVQLGSARTFARNFDWRNSVALWRSAVMVQPRSARAHNNYANALRDAPSLSDQQLALALSEASAAWNIRPTALIGADLAALLIARADRMTGTQPTDDLPDADMPPAARELYEEALSVLLEARKDEATMVNAMYDALRRSKRPLASSRAHGEYPIYESLGVVLLRLDRPGEATRALRHQIALDPYTLTGRAVLAQAYERMAERSSVTAESFRGLAAEAVWENLLLDDGDMNAAAQLAWLYARLPSTQPAAGAPTISDRIAGTQSASGGGLAAALLADGNRTIADHACRALLNLTVQFAGIGEQKMARHMRDTASDRFRCSIALFDHVLSNPVPPSYNPEL